MAPPSLSNQKGREGGAGWQALSGLSQEKLQKPPVTVAPGKLLILSSISLAMCKADDNLLGCSCEDQELCCRTLAWNSFSDLLAPFAAICARLRPD